MDQFSEFGIHTDADEQARRALRAGFTRAGLTRAQFDDALRWYSDHGRQISDPAKIAESFSEFAAAKHWSPELIAAAVAVRAQIAEVGAEAFLGPPPTAEEDAATIVKATELLRTDAAAYWQSANVEMRESYGEALERTQARAEQPQAPRQFAVATAPGTVPPANDADQRRHGEIIAMMGDPTKSREYWASPAIQQEFRDVVTRLGDGSAAAVEPVGEQGSSPERTAT
jgi:hypothetical protein